jgi:hypothetical protein
MFVGATIAKLAEVVEREKLADLGVTFHAGFALAVGRRADFLYMVLPALVPELAVSCLEVLAHRGEIMPGQSDIGRVGSFHLQFQ